ncbi:MAG TPA: S1 RNA-binding domain-containing protein, partial [Patescibacteria group bacterium]|nr:S1 RNA-binding domain-containing protein [Patescibacteria group bacterium]
MPRAKKDPAAAAVVEETKTAEVQVDEVKEEKVAKKAAVKSAPKETKPKEIKASTTKAPTTMEELLASAGTELRVPKVGDVLEGVITEVTKKAVLVDIAGKTEGVVVDKEFDSASDYIRSLKQGDTISVYVTSTENDRGQILLSLRRAAMNQRWDQFSRAMQTGETVTVRGLELNKGGMIVGTDGIRGFIPTSQFSKQYIGKLDTLLNHAIKTKVIEVDKEKNRLIFSERHVSEADLIAQKSAALSKIEVGSVYEGTVSGVMPFGVFVALGVEIIGEGGKKE